MAKQQSDQEARAAAAAAKIALFKKLAGVRVSKTLRGLRSVALLANKNKYVYDDAQKDKIMKAIEADYLRVVEAFAKPTQSAKAEEFTL